MSGFPTADPFCRRLTHESALDLMSCNLRSTAVIDAQALVGVGDTVLAKQLAAEAQAASMTRQPQWDFPVDHKFSLLLVQASDSDAAVLCNMSYSGERLCCLPGRIGGFKHCMPSQACFSKILHDSLLRFCGNTAAR